MDSRREKTEKKSEPNQMQKQKENPTETAAQTDCK